jgi:plastocyanin
MRRAIPFAVLGACLAVGVLPALAADQAVAIHDFSYAPAQVAVMPGETVTWQADGTYMHSVHFDGEPTGLGPPSETFTASRTFPDEGKFTYHCDVHASMHGTVYVNATGTVPEPTPGPSPTATASPTTSPTPTPSGAPSSPPGGTGGSTTAPVSSFRVKVSSRKHRVFVTLTVSAAVPVRVRGTLRRGKKRVRTVTLLGRPGKHKLRLPGKRLAPGRYTLTLKAGDVKRVVHFRARR